MAAIKDITITSYNINSWAQHSKRAELFDIIDKHSTDIVLLQETRLTSIHKPRLKNMRIYRNDAKRGTSVAVSSAYKVDRIHIPNIRAINITATQLETDIGKIMIASIYVPCSIQREVLKREMDTILEHGERYKGAIIGGDMNARSVLWDKKYNSNGGVLKDIRTEAARIKHLTPDQPTHAGGSVFDHFLVSNNILTYGYELKVSDSGSDHNPITIEIKEPFSTVEPVTSQRRDQRKTNWPMFRLKLTGDIFDLNVPKTRNMKNEEMEDLIRKVEL